MKIYTKTGDKGKTSLYGGQRLSKDDVQIEAYGTVDELNSYLGWIASLDLLNDKKDFFQNIQSQLFNIGSHLASSQNSDLTLPEISSNIITEMEEEIDSMNAELPKLKSFVLPGGSSTNAMIHISRTVCRRAERRVVSVSREMEVKPVIIILLNRLSDYLFVLARFASFKEGENEIPWVGNTK